MPWTGKTAEVPIRCGFLVGGCCLAAEKQGRKSADMERKTKTMNPIFPLIFSLPISLFLFRVFLCWLRRENPKEIQVFYRRIQERVLGKLRWDYYFFFSKSGLIWSLDTGVEVSQVLRQSTRILEGEN